MPASRGMTLVEVIISLGLFGLVLLLVGQLTVASHRVHTKTDDKATVFRGATVAADRLVRELRLCQELYSPASFSYGNAYGAEPGQRFHLVFRRSEPSTGDELVVGYRFDGQKRSVDRLLYEPDFDPAQPSSWSLKEVRTLASGVDGLTFTPLDPDDHYGAPFARVEVSMLAESSATPVPGSPVLAEVRVKGL